MLIKQKIAECCKKLRLSKNIIENMAVINETDPEKFMLTLFELELDYREKSRVARYVNTAGFHSLKSFDTYDFSEITLPEDISIKNIQDCDFVRDKHNLIFYGNVGTGKTHLATAIGIEACRQGIKTGFFRTAALVNKLVEAQKGGSIVKFMNKINKLDLLICDEWGYVPLDRQGSQLLFQIISDFYECKSLIITTNLEFSKWINIFYDKQMTAAMIDRIVHYSHLLLFEGESYRIKNSLLKQ
jgi:DNA replication protein DnaC